MAKSKKYDGFEQTCKDIGKLTGGKYERAMRLYEKARFMDEQLMCLQDVLSAKGWVEEYRNGANQSGLKKSSEADVYIALSKNYMSIMKQLEDIVGSVSTAGETDPLNEFV